MTKKKRVQSRSRSTPPGRKKKRSTSVFAAAPVTAAELRALRREIKQKADRFRWNPETEDVQRSVAQLVLTIVESLRQLMERQAIRRMEAGTLSDEETESVGLALMNLQDTITDLAKQFDISPDELNLDLGPVGKLL